MKVFLTLMLSSAGLFADVPSCDAPAPIEYCQLASGGPVWAVTELLPPAAIPISRAWGINDMGVVIGTEINCCDEPALWWSAGTDAPSSVPANILPLGLGSDGIPEGLSDDGDILYLVLLGHKRETQVEYAEPVVF